MIIHHEQITWAGEQPETGRWHPRPPSEPWRPSAHPRWQSPWSSASWEEGWWEWKPSQKIMMIIKMIMMINLGSGIPCWLGLSSHRPLHLLRKSYILIIKVMIFMIMFMFWRWGGTGIRWWSRSDLRFLSSLEPPSHNYHEHIIIMIMIIMIWWKDDYDHDLDLHPVNMDSPRVSGSFQALLFLIIIGIKW